MKRSEINTRMKKAEAFMREKNFFLPPFAFWTPKEWASKGSECDEIRRCALGWDVTDFGRGDFSRMGLLLFTLRNGTVREDSQGGKTYAEKIMIVEKDQVTPCHFHWKKQEDIINRAGGTLVIQVWPSNDQEELGHGPVEIQVDGVSRITRPGGVIRLVSGESITLNPGIYHKFWAEESRCLVGEVSSVNDDNKDNRFLDPVSRFSILEEDETPLYLLCNEYPPPR